MINSSQLRAARALLGWSAQELADHAGVHLSTVQRFERCEGPVRGNIATLHAVLDTLHENGISLASQNRKLVVSLER